MKKTQNSKGTMLGAIFSLTCAFSFAQTVNYTVDDFSNTLSPVKPSIVFVPMLPQLGLSAEGAIGNNIGYNVVFRKNILKFGLAAKQEEVGNAASIKNGSYFEASGDYFFFDETKDARRDMKIIVNDYGSYKEYFNASVKKRVQSGVHGGFMLFKENYFTPIDSAAESPLEFKDATGKDYTPYGLSYGIRSTHMGLFGGLVFKKVKKCVVRSDGWKYYRHYARRFYVDAILKVSTYKDLETATGVYDTKEKDPSPFGYRLGFEFDQMSSVVTFEIGSINRATASSFALNYALLSFSFNLYNSDKRYGMK